MTPARLPERAPLAEHDTTERLSADDMATLHAEQHLQAAHLAQARMSRSLPASAAGVCTNCGAPCLPLAVYCDDECRADHEHRLRVQRRQGAAR